MSSESPFRVSSTALMAACILCGLLVASLLFLKLSPPTAVSYFQIGDDSRIASANASLQKTLAEFKSDEQGAVKQRPAMQITDSAPRSVMPVSVAEILKQSSPRVAPSIPRTKRETTVVDRNVTQSVSPTLPVPQFYAPVTVHPVTVNVDNSGVMRELSRVHERLDSLSKASITVGQPPSSTERSETSQLSTPILYRVHSNRSQELNQPQSTRNSRSEKQERQTIEPILESQPTTEFQHAGVLEETAFTASTTRQEEIPDPAPVSIPVAAQLVVAPVAAQSVPPSVRTVTESAQVTVQFGMESAEPAAEMATEWDVPQLVPDSFDEDIQDETAEELQLIEFPGELFSVPEPDNASEFVVPNQGRSVSSATPDPIVQQSIRIPPPLPERPPLPEFDWSLIPNQQGAKRTTDPPFMNGRLNGVPARRFPIASQPGQVQRASYTKVNVPVPASPSAIGVCRNCESVERSEMLYHPPAMPRPQSPQPQKSAKSTTSRVLEKVGKFFQR